MEKTYDLLIFIGRFQPFHSGHQRVVQLALQQAKHVLILVGSSFKARDIKNPFTFGERQNMILESLEPQDIAHITIRPLRDYLYNDNKWMAEVQKHVDINSKFNDKIGVIGHDKDDSSWYLKAFPQWDFIEVGHSYDASIDATTIRNMWLSGQSPNFTSGVLRDSVHSFIYNKFIKREYERLVREYDTITKGKQQWKGTPYEVQFMTVDAVVVQSGHVLLVRRRAAPGEGLWAIPGGYLNANETFENGMLRELREETKIKVPEPVLRGCIKASHVFDAPNRSLRGRIVTRAYLIELPPGELPKVKGSDDAAKAKWIPLADFEKMEEEMFEDHHHIVSYFLGRV
ncbi:MAG: bifunctional nicotinamide-nucleotide adenylyltransferase/Nudix hydroxylase [Thaumarchaeota archaeon]|nr:bifunctional nicotinamide-nucleotide adenylyltransferase/Nudix hydroxylase [Nitrososphaerota archaeon]